MIVTYNWLKEYVDFDLSPEALSDLLTMLGLEVEKMDSVGNELDTVVVARVELRSQHPNADKLSVCKVNNGNEILDVVCGAQNFKSGDFVALAQTGSVLPGDFKIKKSKIRGEESCGMLCSEKELGLAAESEGIMILPEGLKLGTPLFDALGLKDTIFEIGLTPNRSDCLSVIGIAREIAAKLGKEVKYPASPISESGEPITSTFSVEIIDPDLCPRYTARLIRNAKIAPSPKWLSARLSRLGIRSINNVVDITNYVLMEYGHPLHAFDLDLLKGGKIVVKRAEEGEKFTTLDGQERTLTAEDLTIRDGERGVALAGVMGGLNSEISPETVNILLESAYFNPFSIRRTSKRTGVKSESSYRFERGADIDGVIRALDRAASLIQQLAKGEVSKGIIDVYPEKITKPAIELRCSRVNSILGTALGIDRIEEIIKSLHFTVKRESDDRLKVDVPLYRVDIDREIDLIEEIARLDGYQNIPATLPSGAVEGAAETKTEAVSRRIREIMVANGFNEVINFSFTHPDSSRKLLLDQSDFRHQAIPLLNPIVTEQSVMRTTLLPSILETAAFNFSHRELRQRIFELRRLYVNKEGRELPEEPLWLCALITGMRSNESWCTGKEPVDFFDMKGVVESLLAAFNVGGVKFTTDTIEPYLHPGKSAVILSGKRVIGTFGEIHPEAGSNFDLNQPVITLELSVGALMECMKSSKKIIPPSKFPEVARDIALLVDDELPSSVLIDAVERLKIPEILNASVFDLYKGEKLPQGKKSIALRIRYNSVERTLTDDEVNRLHSKVTVSLEKASGAEIR